MVRFFLGAVLALALLGHAIGSATALSNGYGSQCKSSGSYVENSSISDAVRRSIALASWHECDGHRRCFAQCRAVLNPEVLEA
jgi:hypothetical protein